MIIKRILLFAAIMVFCPLLDAQTIVSYEKPSKKEFVKAVDAVLSKTECTVSDMDERLKSMGIIQRELNNFTSQQWRDYNSLTK